MRKLCPICHKSLAHHLRALADQATDGTLELPMKITMACKNEGDRVIVIGELEDIMPPPEKLFSEPAT